MCSSACVSVKGPEGLVAMAGAISTDAGQWQDVNLYRQQFPFSVCYKFTDEKVICYFATHLTSNAFYLHQIPAACQPSRQSRAFIVLTPVGAVLWCCVQRLPLVYRSLQITLTRGGGWSVSSALKPAPADCGRLVGTRTVPSPHSNHSNTAWSDLRCTWLPSPEPYLL